MEPELLRRWDHDHVWHPFTPMQEYRQEETPLITHGEGFFLYDADNRSYIDGNSSLWCNIHGHRVPELDAALRLQLNSVAHSTLLGLSSPPSIELAHALVDLTPHGLETVFYSDSGSTSVEVALKMAWQYHAQSTSRGADRNLFVGLGGAYHGDTIGSVSLGGIELFHRTYKPLLFEKLLLPAPATYRIPEDHTPATYLKFCFDELERILETEHSRIVAVVIEPLVQGAAGILVHPPSYLKRVRELTWHYNLPLIVDEVAVGFGRTGTMFACEQEEVTPDFLCLAKGLTGGYLPLAATLTTRKIEGAFLADPAEGKTFYHGHTYTGNALGCAVALASLDLFEQNDVLANVSELQQRLKIRLREFAEHPHIGDIRQRGIMAGLELVINRETKEPFPPEQRIGHRITKAARKHGLITRPLGDVLVIMPAPAMPVTLLDQLCDRLHAALRDVLPPL